MRKSACEPAWKNRKDEADIVGIYNHSIERAQQTAARHDIPHAYDDCDKMLREIQPDIACVCTPNISHKEYTLAALNAGAHVFCEKPIATRYADAVEMFARAEERGKILFVTQTGRFSNRTINAKEIAASGQLGEMYYAETSALRRRGVPNRGAKSGYERHRRRLPVKWKHGGSSSGMLGFPAAMRH